MKFFVWVYLINCDCSVAVVRRTCAIRPSWAHGMHLRMFPVSISHFFF
jgi:hypothetical protein